MLGDLALALFVLAGSFCLCALGFVALKRFDEDQYEDEFEDEEESEEVKASEEKPAEAAAQPPTKEEG